MSYGAGAVAARGPSKAFSALGLPGYRAYLATLMLTMMADNVEHVISYWVAFRQFHSAALGGFAVVSHWTPYLALAVTVGGLNDRLDSRRLIQAGGLLFMFVSAGWGYFFWTDSLQMWHAMVLLALHGCASLLWVVSGQVLLYYIVGPEALPSAVRLSATARYLGLLVGPGVGSVILLTLGPTRGIFLNILFYLPLVIWLIGAPYGRQFRGDHAPQRRAVRGLADIVGTIREAGLPVDLAFEGEPTELAPGVDLAAYRVIQEALTNALKYAGPARAWVTVRWRDDEVEVEIANDGRSEAAGDGTGHGLVGLRERVALVGGTIDSGPRAGGGFVVTARLPHRGRA